MARKVTIEKVVPFAQSEKNAKKFRNDLPVSDELRKVMLNEVMLDFMKYAWECCYLEYLPILKEYVKDHDPKEEKQYGLVKNLFWWKIFYESSQNFRNSFIEDYITDHYSKLSKTPILISLLRECQKSISKFYFVGYKFNDYNLVVMDILDEKPLNVTILDPLAIAPRQGEIVMGTLLPLGYGLFTPIIDFYHFDYEARKDIVMCIHHYHDQHLNTSSMHDAFIHVLSAMLQIERLVFLEQQEKLLHNINS
jgi:hypothetical protein